MKLSILTLSTLLYATAVLGRPLVKRAGADDWRSRSIYQLLTDRFAGGGDCSDLSDYCGGNYQDMIDHLDYIQGMGFDAIWISPIPTNSPGGYHGYWATDFNGLNENFGSKEDLKALVDAAHKLDMYVMLDVVANHAGQPSTAGDYSGYTFDSADQYHSQCKIDYDDQNSIEQCWVADVLPDINTEDDNVVKALNDIVKNWVTTYGFDGIRIDTVKHVRQDFWDGYNEAAGVFATGEVFDGDSSYVGAYQKHLDSLLNYPMYYALNDVFGSGKGFSRISEMIAANADAFTDTSVLTNFIDNHDNPRFLNTNKDTSLFKNALTYVLLADGIPVVYYGSEQGFSGGADPANREALWTTDFDTSSDLYKFMATVNKDVRQKENKKVVMDVDVQDNVYAFMHGNALVVLNNYGSGASNEVTVKVGSHVADDANMSDVFSNTTVSVSGGSFTFKLDNGNPAIFTTAS
ncbi:hypothetical protein O0I10_007291 [Lichtheimia ornata]|uniref:alpha-amylase n=1 Tax=Lichtheimia ornata TaxID=688661 RepID=A0AAD7V2K3_9FUNG|nr:uncharacterized protein O0I10_007291 [Lichtheimia ornata]KAJ8656957.1 hypothetical protein O0I10_007291 [Lichtheimia ornata]